MPANEATENTSQYESIVNLLRNAPYEGTWYEFKSNLQEPNKIGQYVSALANSATHFDEEFGYIVWGVDDSNHDIIGTTFDHEKVKQGNQALEPWLAQMLDPVPSYSFHYLEIESKRIALLQVSAAHSSPVAFSGIPYIRIGSHVKRLHDHPMEEKILHRKLDRIPFEYHYAKSGLELADALNHLDINSYFALQGHEPQSNQDVIRNYLVADKLIDCDKSGNYAITNLGAILFANNLKLFPSLERKAPRVIKYKGVNKINAEKEQIGVRGYASGFEGLIDYIQGLLPANEHIESALRVETYKYPPVAIRELVANALIHQDFTIRGTGPMIEIYDDRLEISNAGNPLIDPSRFVDAPPRSRNEKLAAMMRRARICEERGSGWDRIASIIELYQLPAPKISLPEDNTVVTLSSPRQLSDMDNEEKVRAVYLHACLRQVSNQTTTNRTIRERFKLTDKESAKASATLKLALEAGKIVPKDPNAGRKLMEYLPYWAAASRPLI
ncbi:RNA-binding domain-containing protein [Corynebacterium sp. ATCC 6931]|uniref:RNA-binding domain-containing protein n=1 Tax=Corynebacterium sp. ATCC 6931 TaxID=1487956 RepID=UPI0004F8DF7F|nr:RNA-binding domain-containing protein [Corynebacterium sp. ATCC 6931]AIN82194.1 divergent AAA domain protein [Corynebacterium sp. ATCC 6931]